MRLRLAVAAVLLLAIFSCLPDSAGADSFLYWLPAGRSLTAEFKGSNGYRIHIFSLDRGTVLLRTQKGGISTDYVVGNAFVGADRMRAKLPGLGSISLRFHPSGAVRHPAAPGNCEGPRETVREGVARGTIRFVGEREYTQAERHEVRAESVEWEKLRCRFRTHKRGARNWVGRFLASEWEGGPTGFTATKYRPGVVKGGRVVFDARTFPSSKGPLTVYRRATVVAPASTFRVPEPDTYPEHVILSPPPPFAGTGTFARTPESTFTWEGDLSIQFPGIDPIPLTGPSFEPRYCAMRGCAE